MHPLVQFMVPASMFTLMTIIGMELTRTDFRRVLQFPRMILLCCLAQLLGLPLLALLLIGVFQPGAAAAIGLLVFSACPGGGLSNALTLYARGNVAFSVTLTAVTCLASLAALPVVITLALWWTAAETGGSGIPVLQILAQLLFLVLLPVLLGMHIRARFSVWVLQHYRALQRLNLVLLVVVLGVSFGVEDKGIIAVADILAAIPIAAAFVAGSVLIALATARAGQLGRPEGIALLIEFMLRNSGIMALILIAIMQRPDLIAVPTVCFLLQITLTPLLVVILRRRPLPAS